MTKMDLMSKDFDDYSENNEIDEKIKPVKNLKDLLSNFTILKTLFFIII